jgi:outer membrane lipoprotein-sorting protein
MKCAIFYLSLNPGKDRQRIVLDDKTWGYVRVEVTDNADGEYGLSKAKPEAGEMVMNSHPIEGDV